MKMLRYLLICLPCLLTAQESPHFTNHPALSPDGTTLVFSYNGDLWKVPTAGGAALRISALEGNESHPRISPDGKWIAFSGAQKGNNDIYVMPMGGGEVEQLTHHAGNDQMAGWSWNSETIYFVSGRHNRGTTFTVARGGGTPTRLFNYYFNTIHNPAVHPKTGELYFNESWESSIFTQRKRYRGPFNPDIKSFDLASGEVSAHTDWEGKDMWPMVSRDGDVYFVSDRDNDEYNLYKMDGGKARRLTKFSTSVRAPSISADGGKIAFVRDYQIHVYDTKSGKTNRPAIDLSNFVTLDQTADFKTHKNITYFDVSYDAKKLAFVSRGEVFVSDMEGKFIRELDTGTGRAMEVKWLKDDKTLVFTATKGGYQNLYTIPADGSGKMTRRTDDQRNNRSLEVAPDSIRLAYLSGRDEVRVLNLTDFSNETLAQDEIWGFQNYTPRWSPDGRYLAYGGYRSFEQDIILIDTENDNQRTNLTNTGVSEGESTWSPDGKHIYFTSSRRQPNYPRGGGDSRLYRLPLRKIDAPFRSEGFEDLFADEKEDEDKKKDSVVVAIDAENIMERVQPVGPRAGNQYGLAVVRDGDKTVAIYGSNHEGKSNLYKTVFEPFEDTKTEKITTDGIGGASDLVTRDGKHYLVGNGQVMKLDLGQKKAEAIETKHTFRRALRPEFEQMFYETWANVEENFYNPDFHGADWAALRDRYATYLPHLTSRADLRRLTNDLLGELNTSHYGFRSNGSEERTKTNVTSVSLGLAFEPDRPYVIKSVLADGPADHAGIDIQPGDRITAIDGTPINESQNRERYLTRPSVDQELALTLVQTDGQEKTVRLHPEPYGREKTHRYDEWVDDNQARVDEASDERVAYVHMKNMGGSELNNFLNEMVSESYRRDALILDLRYNTGGNVHDDVLQFLSQRPYAIWKYRGGADSPQPNFAPRAKPTILLINQQSLSDAEVTAEGFKQLGLGTVVGTPTYRWIIFTSGKGLVDGSFYRLPAWGVYGLDGRNLEKTGVEPEIRIDNTAADRQAGRDPQLDKAIELALDGLRGK